MSDINIENTKINTVQNSKEVSSTGNSSIEENDNIFDSTKQKANGILEEFNQGYLGDCGLISTLVSFKNSEKGSEYIKQAITQTDSGYCVDFKGINKTYEISFKELQRAQKAGYSQGKTEDDPADADALLLELAFEKACDEDPSGLMKFKHGVSKALSILPFLKINI